MCVCVSVYIYDNEDGTGAVARASSAQVWLCSRGCWSGRRSPTAACMCVCNNMGMARAGI